MHTTLILPQYTRADLTLACLDSIRRHETQPWPILVLDDGSPDDAADRVAAATESGNPHDANTTLLRQPRLGLTAAWNRAAAAATTSHLVFLNNDVLAHGPFVERLVQPLVANTALMTGARFRREAALPRAVLEQLPTRDFLEGWCFALRADLFHSLGGFDESFTLYWSDTDLQCRLVESAPAHSAPLVAVPNLPLHHLAHRTTHAQPARRTLWKNDRDAFPKKGAPRRDSPLPPALRGERGRG